MMKMIFTFILMSFAVGVLTTTIRQMSGKERWQLTKMVAFSVTCSIIATLILITLVVLF